MAAYWLASTIRGRGTNFCISRKANFSIIGLTKYIISLCINKRIRLRIKLNAGSKLPDFIVKSRKVAELSMI